VAGAGECGDETSDSIKCGEFIVAEDLLGSQEGLCSMEFSSVLVKFGGPDLRLPRLRNVRVLLYPGSWR
jgi:hypothetical protein